jgi:glutathione synthase/RimK-type ligase-like ATP-grasp enzyme
VFSEVNVSPGIRGIEEASKINIAGRLISFIVEDLRNG